MMTLTPCSGDGLKFLDLSVGSGDEVSKGKRVVVSPWKTDPFLGGSAIASSDISGSCSAGAL